MSPRIPSSFTAFESIETCPACSSTHIKLNYFPNIFSCADCRVHFRNPRPTQEEIQRCYNLGNLYHIWAREKPIRDRLWKTRLGILLGYIQNGKLLDVGTGDGHFLSFAGEHFDVTATEISDPGIQLAKLRGFKVLKGTLEELCFPENSFDVVTLWHTLEHLPNPGATLKFIHTLLRHNGILVFAVPNETYPLIRNNFKKLIGKEYRWTPYGLNYPGGEIHLIHFHPKTINRLVNATGFHVLKFGVDDVYTRRDFFDLTELVSQKVLNRILNWHFARAMYLVCRKV